MCFIITSRLKEITTINKYLWFK